MLNAETARIARSADPKTVVSIYREFVAFFCTKRRDERRVFVWEVIDWQGVTNFEESMENYFGRILLPGGTGGTTAVRHDGEVGDEGGRGAGVKRQNRSVNRTGWPMGIR